MHLKSARAYEDEKRIPDPATASKVDKFDQDFIYRYSPILDAISRAVVEERLVSPWLVDNDVAEVYKALYATMKTLESGLYYESLPDGPVRASLFRRVKAVLDERMQPQASADRRALKISEGLDVLDFLMLAAQVNCGVRPRSRRYLDWLTEMAGASVGPSDRSGLILP